MENRTFRTNAAALAALFISGALAGGALKERALAQAHAAEPKVKSEAQADESKNKAAREADMLLTKSVLAAFGDTEQALIGIRDNFRLFGAPVTEGGKTFENTVGSGEYAKAVNNIRMLVSRAFQASGELRYELQKSAGTLSDGVVAASKNLFTACSTLDKATQAFDKDLHTQGTKLNAFITEAMRQEEKEAQASMLGK